MNPSTPPREPLPIMTPQHDRYDRAAGLRPDVRTLARTLVDRGGNPLCEALAAALQDPYHDAWVAESARVGALDFWAWELTPAVNAVYQDWFDHQEALDLLSAGHHLLALLAALLDRPPAGEESPAA
jgi:hypothetical protein